MHELLFDMVRDARVPPVLARLPLDDGGLVAAFDRGAGRGAAPRWIAKLAYGAPACERLRAEARALARLEPVALQLQAPRLLGWRESEEESSPQACLVQSGLVGGRMSSRWPGRPERGLPPQLGAVRRWLGRFQAAGRRHALLSHPASLGDLMAEAAGAAQRWMQRSPEFAPLFRPLAGVVLQSLQSQLDQPAVAIHGDFWAGNCLLQRSGEIAVIDWSGLQPGSALEDILTFTARLACGPERAPWSMLESWQHLWFTPGAGREFLRDWAGAVGYSDHLARSCFYLFLLRRLGWELGFALQTRNQSERSSAQVQWDQALTWLARHRFPDPFTPFPVAA